MSCEIGGFSDSAIVKAYVDFAQYSALAFVQEFENMIVLRTLSQRYSLAGLRLSTGIANPKLLAGLFKVKDSYNIDAIATMELQRYKTYKMPLLKK